MPSDRYITLNDFRPGIHSDLHSVGSFSVANMDTTKASIPINGAATIDKTYRCCADPRSGALIPLPRLVLGKSQVLLPNGNANSGLTYYQTGFQGAYLMDAVMNGPMYTSADGQYAADPFNTFALYQFKWDVTGASTYRNFVLGMVWENWRTVPLVLQWIWSKQVGSAGAGLVLGSGSLDRTRAVSTLTPALAIAFSNQYIPIVVAGFGCIAKGTLGWTAGAIPANELAVTTKDTDMTAGGPGNYSITAGTSTSTLAWFPDPLNPVVVSSLGSVETIHPYIKFVAAHQGRILAVYAAEVIVYGPGAGGPVSQSKDIIAYYPVFDPNAVVGGTTWSQRGPAFLEAGEDQAAFIDTVGSLSADELLVVKSRDGGFVIRGDMDNPTVQRLPFIESGGGVCARGAVTPMGFVYGSTNGVFLWAGGEQSKKLSDQIEGFFWNHASEPYGNGYRGRFAHFHPWVAVPNNYFYDTRTESWWRIDMPDSTHLPFNVYEPWPGNQPTSVSATNKLRCFPYKLTATRNEAWYDLDPAVLATSYSWQSQPLFETAERLVSVQEVIIVASVPNFAPTTPTVTVTLTGYTEAGVALTPVVTTFNLSTSTVAPQQMTKSLVGNFVAMHVQVQIQAADGASEAAPKVHSVQIGLADRARVAKAN